MNELSSDYDSPWKEASTDRKRINGQKRCGVSFVSISLSVLPKASVDTVNIFKYALWGCRAGLEFPVVKLLDYERQWEVLEQSRNPFSVMVMSHLKAQATRQDPEGRLQWKLRVVRGLYERGYRRTDILELFRFVDQLLVLPEELEHGFEETLAQYEEGKKMPYITSIERIGIKKGILQNAREDVLEVLETRFVEVPQTIVEVINGLEDASILKILLRRAITIGSLEEFKEILGEYTDRHTAG